MTNRTSYARLQRLEKRCLVPDCYTSKEAFNATTEAEREEYIGWLEQQCGEFFSALN